MTRTPRAPNELARLIARQIGAEGPMNVDAFMELCLAHPEHGYYITRDPLGSAGDFTTSPEISQMFGELLGLWAADMWMKLGSPDRFTLAELGPGRGTLMADALRATARVPGFAKAARIALVETSPVLRSVQRKAVPLAEHFDNVHALPDGPLIVLANEFFDALPIKQFIQHEGRWHERTVALDAGASADKPHFVFERNPDSVSADALPFPVTKAEDGAIVETCPAALSIASHLATRLANAPGAALIIDYGHKHSGVGDTLQALHHHKYANVLDDPGEADLTAHVDFEALARAMPQATPYEPTTQGAFLSDLGIGVRADFLKSNATKAQAQAIDDARTRLTAPDQMGNLFKVMAVTSKGLPTPAGF